MPAVKLLTLVNGVTLGRVRMQVFHATSSSNPAPVASAGATVKAYRLGAVSAEQVELFEGMTAQIQVSDAGEVQVGDVLFADSQVDAAPSEWLSVTAIAANRSWIEVQYSGYRLLILVGTRMTPSNNPPQMHTGSLAGTPVASVDTDMRGECDFFLEPRSFDYTIHHPAGSGWASELANWQAPAESVSFDGWVSAADHPTLQAAVDSLPSWGGTVFVPAGTWPQAGPLLFPPDRPVRLLGAGRSATLLHWATDPTGGGSAQSDGLIRVRGDNQVIEGLTIRGPGGATRVGPGRGVVVGRRLGELATTHPLDGFQLRDCDIRETQGWALYVYGKNTASDPYVDPNSDLSISIMGSVRDCTFASNGADGAMRFGEGTVAWGLERVGVGASKGLQLHAIGTTLLRCEGCTFDEPADDLSGKVLLQSCSLVTFDGCDFENPISTLDTPYFITITESNNKGISILNCNFFRAPAASVPSGSKKDLPSKLITAVSGVKVRGLRIANVTLYMHLGDGIAALAENDLLIGDPESEIVVEGSVRGDDTTYSELRINSRGLRTAIVGPRRIRVPSISGAELQSMTPATADVVEGDMTYNTTDGKLYVYSKLSGTAGWHAVTVS